MHKTVSVSIGSTPFVIEESAYASLDSYLRSIRTHFAKSGDAEEITEDIETRIAEEFSAKLNARKKVIVIKDVEDVIHMMGTVEDFRKFETGEDEPAGRSFDIKKIRLYRDADNQIIAGVCSGIAKFFGIDPLITRLVFGLSIFMGGFGVVLYIILWIILPEARTTAEKVEMTGSTVTLSSIQDKIDQTLPPEKRKSMIRKIFAFPFVVIGTLLRGIGKLLKIVVPFLGRIAGFLMILASALAIAGITFVLLALLLNPSSPYIGLPLQDILGATAYATLAIAGYFIALMPVIFLLMIASSLLTMRNHLTLPSVAGLFGIWLSALVVAGVTGFTVAPAVEVAAERYENEHFEIVTRPYEVTDFDRVSVGGDTILEVTQGETFSVTLSGTEQDLARMDVTVTEGFLTAQQQPVHDRCMFFCPHNRITMQVTMPELAEVTTSGVAHATLEGFDSETITLDASGNSSIEATVDADELMVNTSGVSHIEVQSAATTQKAVMTASGNSHINARVSVTDLMMDIGGVSHVELHGSGATMQANLEGNSSLDAFNFPVRDATMELSGVSHAMIDASNSIRGSSSGNSRVLYQKDPALIEMNVTGNSHVEHVDEDFEDFY